MCDDFWDDPDSMDDSFLDSDNNIEDAFEEIYEIRDESNEDGDASIEQRTNDNLNLMDIMVIGVICTGFTYDEVLQKRKIKAKLLK
jgi:hypothetical protein